eukprot:CAMPEP_0118888524 /NCGR_PEP_ID=MMETSP1163-20130328/25764_1 /TAXON_ID=124430 /ORGANISM="Phaeomonas parva, Strain CCMP2877" /LENGTH=1412 /DNA_ID=CAMNT_0006827091 /DNA_START=261 /DNA_END=4500 /DNA_ORIENTATION=-
MWARSAHPLLEVPPGLAGDADQRVHAGLPAGHDVDLPQLHTEDVLRDASGGGHILGMQIFVLALVVAGGKTTAEDVVAPGIYAGFTIFVYYLSLWPFLRHRDGIPLSGFLVKLFRYIMYQHSIGAAAQATGLLVTSRAWSDDTGTTELTVRSLLAAQLFAGLAWWLLGYSAAFVKDLNNASDETVYARLTTYSKRYGGAILVFFVAELVFQIYIIAYCLDVWPRGRLTMVAWWCLFGSAVFFIVTLAALLLSTTTNRVWLDDIQQFIQDLQVRSSASIDFGFRGVVEAHPGSVILTPALVYALVMTLPLFVILGVLRNHDLINEDCDSLREFLFTALALGFTAVVLSAVTLICEMAYKKWARLAFDVDLAFLASTTALAVFTVIFSGAIPSCDSKDSVERELVRRVITWSALAYVGVVGLAGVVFCKLAGSIELEGDLWALWGFNAEYYESHRASLAGRRCFATLKTWYALVVPSLIVELCIVATAGVGRTSSEGDSSISDGIPAIDDGGDEADNIVAVRALLGLSFFAVALVFPANVFLTALTRLRGPLHRWKNPGRRNAVGAASHDATAEAGEVKTDTTNIDLENPGAPPVAAVVNPSNLSIQSANGLRDSQRVQQKWLFEDARIGTMVITGISAVIHASIGASLLAGGEASHIAAALLMLLVSAARLVAAVSVLIMGDSTSLMERAVAFEEAHQASVAAAISSRRASEPPAPVGAQASFDDWGIVDAGDELNRQRLLSVEQRRKLWTERANHPEARDKLWVRRINKKGAVIWVEAGTQPKEYLISTPKPASAKGFSREEEEKKTEGEAAAAARDESVTEAGDRVLHLAGAVSPPLRRTRSATSRAPGGGMVGDVESADSSQIQLTPRGFGSEGDVLSERMAANATVASVGGGNETMMTSLRNAFVSTGREQLGLFFKAFADVIIDDEEELDAQGRRLKDTESPYSDEEVDLPPPRPTGGGINSQWLRQLNPDGSVAWVDGAVFLEDNTNLAAFDAELSSYDLAAAAVLPLAAKVDFFREQVQKLREGHDASTAVTLTLSRQYLYQTAKDAFLNIDPKDFRKLFRISMAGEEGVDVGGVLRDFFEATAVELVNKSDLFAYSATDNITYQLNRFATVLSRPDAKVVSGGSVSEPVALDAFRFAGRFLGKALVDEVNVDIHFIRPLYKHILGLPLSFSDLEFSDRSTYESLKWILDNDGVEYLSLDFTVTETDPKTNAIVEIELVPGGRAIAVTDDNKGDYVRRMFEYKMLHSIEGPLNEFLRGLYEVVPLGLLSVFDFQELELLFSGLQDIDVADWKAHTIYEGELRPGHPVSRWFFEILLHFDSEQRARLLQYVTGTSRVPVGGFRNLQGDRGLRKAFELRGIEGGDAAWPRVHTCFNRLDLPIYTSRRKLREVLTRIILLEASDAFTIS